MAPQVYPGSTLWTSYPYKKGRSNPPPPPHGVISFIASSPFNVDFFIATFRPKHGAIAQLGSPVTAIYRVSRSPRSAAVVLIVNDPEKPALGLVVILPTGKKSDLLVLLDNVQGTSNVYWLKNTLSTGAPRPLLLTLFRGIRLRRQRPIPMIPKRIIPSLKRFPKMQSL